MDSLRGIVAPGLRLDLSLTHTGLRFNCSNELLFPPTLGSLGEEEGWNFDTNIFIF
jgi:hypothetical protein